MHKRQFRRYDKGQLIIIASYGLIFLDIFTLSQARIEKYSNALPIVVPYITVSETISLPVWMAVVVALFAIGIINKQGKLTIDLIGTFFLIRIILGFIQIAWLLLNGKADTIRWGNYYLYVIELLIYFCSLSVFSYRSTDKYVRMIEIVSLIIAIETIWQCVIGILPKVSYISTWYKACMNIPIGSSNTIGALITPCLLSDLYENKKYDIKRVAFLGILAFAIILTKSRFSMIVCLTGFAYHLFSGFKNMTADQKRTRILCIFATLLLSIYFIVMYFSEIGIVIYGYSDYIYEGGIVNHLSSGRLSTTIKYLEYIIVNPIFGNGPNYEVSRAHNIIIDILYQNGVIGFLIFAIAIVKLLKKSRALSFDYLEMRFMHFYILFSVICSLGEISYFTGRVSDILFIPALAITRIIIVSRENLEIEMETVYKHNLLKTE